MNLIAQRGARAAYSLREVKEHLQMTRWQINAAVRAGRLQRRGNRQFPYLQKDVNEFVVRMNCGE